MYVSIVHVRKLRVPTSHHYIAGLENSPVPANHGRSRTATPPAHDVTRRERHGHLHWGQQWRTVWRSRWNWSRSRRSRRCDGDLNFRPCLDATATQTTGRVLTRWRRMKWWSWFVH